MSLPLLPRFSFGRGPCATQSRRDEHRLIEIIRRRFGSPTARAPNGGRASGPNSQERGSAMRSAAEELEVARTLRTPETSPAPRRRCWRSPAPQGRAAETLSTRSSAVIRHQRVWPMASRGRLGRRRGRRQVGVGCVRGPPPEVANRELLVAAGGRAAVSSGPPTPRKLISVGRGRARAGAQISRAGSSKSGSVAVTRPSTRCCSRPSRPTSAEP